MKRRDFVRVAASAAALGPSSSAHAQGDKWGTGQGYPTGWAGGFSRDPAYRVGNYSGGYDAMVRFRRIAAGNKPAPLTPAPVDLKYRQGSAWATPQQYLDRWPVTGLLIARRGAILHESYRFARLPTMRMASWSMAKSVSSLLLGICLDRGLIASMDDTAERYLPELKGTLHGGTTLRNLANMSSGVAIDHNRDNGTTIYPKGLLDRDSSVRRLVAGWNARREGQGMTFRYNELCPLTIGMVMRQVTGKSLSEFAEQVLWRPLGAEAEATWMTDSESNEFNCVGFAARLRDWARLGMLVAQKGAMGGQQIVSERWIAELTRWTDEERAVRYGSAGTRVLRGYKYFMWHAKADGKQPVFAGHHGQRVYVDMASETVLVQTAVDHEGSWEDELHAMFEAAIKVTS